MICCIMHMTTLHLMILHFIILHLMTLYLVTLYLMGSATHDTVSHDFVLHDSVSRAAPAGCISWLCFLWLCISWFRILWLYIAWLYLMTLQSISSTSYLYPLTPSSYSSSVYASYNFFPFSFPTPLRSCFLCVYAHSLLQSINSVWFLFTLSWTCPVIWPYSSVTWLDSTYSHHISGSVSLFYPRCLFLMRCKVKEKFLLKFV